METRHSLAHDYHNHVLKVVKHSLSHIEKGKEVFIDKKTFDDKTELLDHLLEKHRNHEFFPHEKIQKIQEKVLEQQMHLDKIHTPTIPM